MATKPPDQTPIDPAQEPPEPTEAAKAAQVDAAKKTADADANPKQSEKKIKVKVICAYKILHNGELYAKDSTIEGTEAELDALIQSEDVEQVK